MTLSICIITKNEESNISKCIESVYDIADEIIVTDTGSTDKTIEIASSFEKVKIFNFDWIDDFSKARNFCISKASRDWILSIDCDEILVCNSDLLEYTKTLKDFDVVNFKVTGYHKSVSNNFYTRALFNNNKKIFFTAIVHEFLNSKNNLNYINNDDFIFYHKQKSQPNSDYYIKLLNKAIIIDKSNKYHYFKHLANEYFFIGNYQLSFEFYNRYNSFYSNDLYSILMIIKILIDHYSNFKLALKFCYKFLDLSQDNLEVLLYKAMSLANIGNYKKAISTYNKVISLSHNNEVSYKAFQGLGYSYEKLNQISKSIEFYSKSYDIYQVKQSTK